MDGKWYPYLDNGKGELAMFKEIEGITYGVRVMRKSILKRLLLHLPLVRRLYAKKLTLSVISIDDKEGIPISGVFNWIWVFKNPEKDRVLWFVYAFPADAVGSTSSHRIDVYLRDADCCEIFASRDRIPVSDLWVTAIKPHIWYSNYIDRVAHGCKKQK